MIKPKVLALSYIITLIFATTIQLYIPTIEAAQTETTIIPDEAIRLRILANSDTSKDQQIKADVRDAVNEQITEWVEEVASIEAARTLLQSNLGEIEQIATDIIRAENLNQTVDVAYDTIEFPTKVYGQFIYPADLYEAVIITIGAGKGANWWCVLFPPLCFIDISNGVTIGDNSEQRADNEQLEEQTEQEDANDTPVYVTGDEQPIKIAFFFKEVWDKIFKW